MERITLQAMWRPIWFTRVIRYCGGAWFVEILLLSGTAYCSWCKSRLSLGNCVLGDRLLLCDHRIGHCLFVSCVIHLQYTTSTHRSYYSRLSCEYLIEWYNLPIVSTLACIRVTHLVYVGSSTFVLLDNVSHPTKIQLLSECTLPSAAFRSI